LDAANGQQASASPGRNGEEIHLLLTDVVMPGMGGSELAERMISLRPKVKVLYISGYTHTAIVHHGVLDPGVALLQKLSRRRCWHGRFGRSWTDKFELQNADLE